MPRVLVVDDDPLWLEILEAILALHKIKAVTASSLKDAFTHIQNGTIGIILLDLKLPDSDTENTLKSIRALKLWSKCRVVVVTGYLFPKDFERTVREWGADGVLTKDVEGFETRLMEAIRQNERS